MNFLINILELQGFPFKKAQAELRKIENLSEKVYISRECEQKWKIFNYHLENNRAYSTWIRENEKKLPSKWYDIPIQQKQYFQRPIKELLSDGFTTGNVYINNTSGSSGHPMYFAKDKFCHAMTWAVAFNRYRKHNITYGESLQARFFGIPLGGVNHYKELLKDRFAARVRFPVFDLSDGRLQEFYEKFRKRKFEYLNGYTSSLVLFAKYLQGRGVVLANECPTLKVIIPTSEVLNDIDRKLLQDAFGVPVVNEYGSAEFGVIAFEDEDNDWILSDENLLIEVVDGNNYPVDPGVPGRILITSLYNKAMPFIRYELGDIACFSKKKKHNYQTLKSVEGRTNDIIKLPSGRVSPGLTFYYVSKGFLETDGLIKEFVIKQLKFDTFQFEYVAERELPESKINLIKLAMDKYLEPGLKVYFSLRDKLDRTSAGKLKHFQSYI